MWHLTLYAFHPHSLWHLTVYASPQHSLWYLTLYASHPYSLWYLTFYASHPQSLWYLTLYASHPHSLWYLSLYASHPQSVWYLTLFTLTNTICVTLDLVHSHPTQSVWHQTLSTLTQHDLCDIIPSPSTLTHHNLCDIWPCTHPTHPHYLWCLALLSWYPLALNVSCVHLSSWRLQHTILLLFNYTICSCDTQIRHLTLFPRHIAILSFSLQPYGFLIEWTFWS